MQTGRPFSIILKIQNHVGDEFHEHLRVEPAVETGEMRQLVENAGQAVLAADRRTLFFSRGDTIYAAAFDPETSAQDRNLILTQLQRCAEATCIAHSPLPQMIKAQRLSILPC